MPIIVQPNCSNQSLKPISGFFQHLQELRQIPIKMGLKHSLTSLFDIWMLEWISYEDMIKHLRLITASKKLEVSQIYIVN
jgi:hypothetical protein